MRCTCIPYLCVAIFICHTYFLDYDLCFHSCVEPYNYFGRRGRKEPEALAAASLKRLFVENQPYLVSGHTQHGFGTFNGVVGSKFCSKLLRLKISQLDPPNNILSMAEKYKYMRETFRKRLAFGKDHNFSSSTHARVPAHIFWLKMPKLHNSI